MNMTELLMNEYLLTGVLVGLFITHYAIPCLKSILDSRRNKNNLKSLENLYNHYKKSKGGRNR